MSYPRTIPRDLFNEADLLKCYGRLVILLGETRDHRASITPDQVDSFDIQQDDGSGGITIANLAFKVGGVRYDLQRPLNSRRAWPLLVETCESDPDFDPVDVFPEEGSLSPEFLELIAEQP